MTMINRELLLKKPFKDFRYYPYGFARSGDFSIRESDALSQYGNLITALLTGDYQPQNAEDAALLAVARAERAAVSVPEKAWVKYQSRIHRPPVASLYGKGKFAADSFAGVNDYDSENEQVVDD